MPKLMSISDLFTMLTTAPATVGGGAAAMAADPKPHFLFLLVLTLILLPDQRPALIDLIFVAKPFPMQHRLP